MKDIIDIYKEVVVSLANILAVFLLLGGCCIYYREMIEMLLNSIFYK